MKDRPIAPEFPDLKKLRSYESFEEKWEDDKDDLGGEYDITLSEIYKNLGIEFTLPFDLKFNSDEPIYIQKKFLNKDNMKQHIDKIDKEHDKILNYLHNLLKYRDEYAKYLENELKNAK